MSLTTKNIKRRGSTEASTSRRSGGNENENDDDLSVASAGSTSSRASVSRSSIGIKNSSSRQSSLSKLSPQSNNSTLASKLVSSGTNAASTAVAIQVVCRFRPFKKSEEAAGENYIINEGSRSVSVADSSDNSSKSFSFDKVPITLSTLSILWPA